MILRLSNLKNLEFVRHYVRELASDEPLCRPFLPMQCTVGDNCLNFLLLRPKHIGSFAQNSFQIDLSIENICNFGSRLLEMPLFYKMPLGGIQQLRGHNFLTTYRLHRRQFYLDLNKNGHFWSPTHLIQALWVFRALK